MRPIRQLSGEHDGGTFRDPDCDERAQALRTEIIATAIKRQHEPQHFLGDPLTPEIAEKPVRSRKYQITIAKLRLAKEVEDFVFDEAAVNKALVRDLASGHFLAHQRHHRERRGVKLQPIVGRQRDHHPEADEICEDDQEHNTHTRMIFSGDPGAGTSDRT